MKKIAYGVDLGWVTQLESMGVFWVDDNKNRIDPFLAVQNMGADAIRLRVFVDPPREAGWTKADGTRCMLGYADAKSVLEVAKRVKEKGLRLMIDFHYSDHFADPQYQDIPKDWEKEGIDGLVRKLEEHTKSVLLLLKEHGIVPEWVQVGNEINQGILWPMGSLKEAPQNLIRLLNAGYDAVKEVNPECKVVTHIAGAPILSLCTEFFDGFFENGGKTDIIGLSYYPYWFRMIHEDFDKEPFAENLAILAKKYDKPLMICEVGGPEGQEEETFQLLTRTIADLDGLPNNYETGIFYWEPEVGAALLPDRYPLGAARLVGEKTLQFTKAISAYGAYKENR